MKNAQHATQKKPPIIIIASVPKDALERAERARKRRLEEKFKGYLDD
ncbi:hypothetical protein LJB93_02780 [Desulfovibrio sp. OttesenSCG-928-F07]|nr:hypothetical protein [Desulfovibrio sp. OttesenSCG-928-F07]